MPHNMNKEIEDMVKQNLDMNSIPKGKIIKSRVVPLVWIIPMVALLLGIWLVYKTIADKGPEITITFKNAAGIRLGKTKVKYKSVIIGEVEDIAIKGSEHVVVTASINKSGENFLREGTKFWIVRPRIGESEISGLETIVSGAYIGMDPGTGRKTLHFNGLEKQPSIFVDEKGSIFKLHAEQLDSVYRGSPVYYLGLKSGRVIDYDLDKSGSGVFIRIFIKAPYDLLVRESTRFWKKQSINITYGSDGVDIKAPSIANMISGGIYFDTPQTGEGPASPAKPGTTFKLFEDFKSIGESLYTKKVPYVLNFNESLKGLSKGAPVLFRGIKMGRVTDVRIFISPKTLNITTDVFIEIEPERLSVSGSFKGKKPYEIAEFMVNHGFRAQLASGNLLTGQKVISLDFYPDLPKKSLKMRGEYAEIPTIPSVADELSRNARVVMDEIRKIPFAKISKKLLETIDETRKIVKSDEILSSLKNMNSLLENLKAITSENGDLNKSFENLNRLSANLDEKLERLSSSIEKTLASARSSLEVADMNSPEGANLKTAVEDLSDAARSLKNLSDYLQRHPEAILRGKDGQ